MQFVCKLIHFISTYLLNGNVASIHLVTVFEQIKKVYKTIVFSALLLSNDHVGSSNVLDYGISFERPI